jgi:hypothetical protein
MEICELEDNVTNEKVFTRRMETSSSIQFMTTSFVFHYRNNNLF